MVCTTYIFVVIWYLVACLEHFSFFRTSGIPSSQLTNSYFSEELKPLTRYVLEKWCMMVFGDTFHRLLHIYLVILFQLPFLYDGSEIVTFQVIHQPSLGYRTKFEGCLRNAGHDDLVLILTQVFSQKYMKRKVGFTKCSLEWLAIGFLSMLTGFSLIKFRIQFAKHVLSPWEACLQQPFGNCRWVSLVAQYFSAKPFEPI